MHATNVLESSTRAVLPFRLNSVSQSLRYPNDINLWSRTVSNAPELREVSDHERSDSNWEVDNYCATNNLFPGTYSICLKPTDRLIYEASGLLAVACMPDRRTSNLFLRFYNNLLDLPFLTIALNDRFEIVGEAFCSPYQEAKKRVTGFLSDHLHDPFIADVFKTVVEDPNMVQI